MSGDICEICNAEIIHAGPTGDGGFLVVVFAPGMTSTARTTVCGGCIIEVAKAGVKLLPAPPPFESDPTPPAPPAPIETCATCGAGINMQLIGAASVISEHGIFCSMKCADKAEVVFKRELEGRGRRAR